MLTQIPNLKKPTESPYSLIPDVTMQPPPMALCQSTLTPFLNGNSKSKFMEYASKVWTYVKLPFVKVWEYVLWILHCCPSEKSHLEILENCIDDPEGTAKEFAKDPEKKWGEWILAFLYDPKAAKTMYEENQGKIKQFIQSFKRTDRNWNTLLKGKDPSVLNAFTGFLDPTQNIANKLYTSLQEWGASRPDLFARSMNRLSAQALEILGKEDKEGDGKETKALRSFFQMYLPKIAKWAEENPEKFKDFFKDVYAYEELTTDTLLHLCKDHLTPNGAELEILENTFSTDSLPIRQLTSPNCLTGNYTEKVGLAPFPYPIYQCILQELRSKDIDDLITEIGDNFPLVTSVLTQAKNSMGQIAKNLPEGIDFLTKLLRVFS